MKVYAVNCGEYSDFRYDGIFSSMENAQAYMAAFPKDGYGSYNDVEVWTVDAWQALKDTGVQRWMVQMTKGGDVLVARQTEVDYSGLEHGPDSDWGGMWHHNARVSNEWFAWFEMTAKDREHAIKIANERRIMLLANEAAGR